MKKLTIFLSLFFLGNVVFGQCASRPFALVELFSSEGCSSCPPADEQFNSFALEMAEENVLLIAYHVDYWNGPLSGPCGTSAWKDPFSSAQATEIQSTYKQALNGRSLVTPQFVVQGRHATSIDITGGFREVKKMVKEELKKKPVMGACLQPMSYDKTKNEIVFGYTISSVPGGRDVSLIFVLIENQLVSKVTAGENCNKTLEHQAVERMYVRMQTKESNNLRGEMAMPVPHGVRPEHARLMMFIQDNNSKEVIAGDKGFPIVDLMK